MRGLQDLYGLEPAHNWGACEYGCRHPLSRKGLRDVGDPPVSISPNRLAAAPTEDGCVSNTLRRAGHAPDTQRGSWSMLGLVWL